MMKWNGCHGAKSHPPLMYKKGGHSLLKEPLEDDEI